MDEKKKCKYCQSEIDKKAKICPNCRKNQSHVTRNIILGIIGFILFWSFMLSLSDTPTVSTNNDTNSTQNADSNINIEESKVEGKGKIANYEVEIKEHRITYNYSGKSILLVKLAFTNNNDEEKTFAYNLECKAYQSGIELTTPLSSYGIEGLDWQEKSKNVKSGITYEFNYGFEIDDLKTPVQIEVVPFSSNKYNQKITKTINF